MCEPGAPVSRATVEEYERRAEAAEKSPLPTFLKLSRVVVWLVYAWVLVNTLLLLLAFLLRLFGASTDASFTQWVYRSSEAAMRPFRGIFPSREFGENSVLDTSLLFAIVVYSIVAVCVHAFLHWLGLKLAAQQQKVAHARAAADQVAREYAAAQEAARQSAAQQYEIAKAAAEQALAAQPADPAWDPYRSPPTPPSA